VRILYNYFVSKVSKENTRWILDYLRSRAATSLSSPDKIQGRSIPSELMFKYITTSRSVEAWLQNMEDKIYEMARAKKSAELWFIIGGVGAGKSHIKEYLLSLINKRPSVFSLELQVSKLKTNSTVDDILALVMLQSKPYLDSLFDAMSINMDLEKIRERLRQENLDNEFIDIYCDYEISRKDHRAYFRPLEELLINKGIETYLPLIKLFKRHLGMKGLYIFIDEFEDLQDLVPERQESFISSMSTFFDEIAATLISQELPSFKLLIFCTISFWNVMHDGTRFRALETRANTFEIIPLMDDEIVALAEKILVLYKKSGYPISNTNFRFNQLPAYLVKIASTENEPLTPRFIIKKIINIIENPDEYNKFPIY
jgi:hypothetical protein